MRSYRSKSEIFSVRRNFLHAVPREKYTLGEIGKREVQSCKRRATSCNLQTTLLPSSFWKSVNMYFANSEDPDIMPHKAAFHKWLHRLLRLR